MDELTKNTLQTIEEGARIAQKELATLTHDELSRVSEETMMFTRMLDPNDPQNLLTIAISICALEFELAKRAGDDIELMDIPIIRDAISSYTKKADTLTHVSNLLGKELLPFGFSGFSEN